MSLVRASRRLLSVSRTGGTSFLLLIVFTLSIGASVHNHGLTGFDGGAENVSQSKFTCPACVFGGKPIVVVDVAIAVCDSGTFSFSSQPETSFEQILEETSDTRAPPII